MPLTETIRNLLAADPVLSALLVGGIYHYEQIGRNGISRATTPDAYDPSGFLQPCAIVKAADVRDWQPIRDSRGSYRYTVEIYFYDDGDSGYGAILTARDLLVSLLDRRWIASVGYLRCVGGAHDLRDSKLNNAALLRSDFTVTT